ncbi:MAG: HAD-IC family P-type ATPase [Bacteroidota bacterium]|jgi:Ca2+-transporting ATPase
MRSVRGRSVQGPAPKKFRLSSGALLSPDAILGAAGYLLHLCDDIVSPMMLLMKLWHSIPLQEVFDTFGTHPSDGLSAEAVARSRRAHGANELPREKVKPGYMLLLEQMNNPIIIILLVAAVLTALLADLADSIVIFVVVIINTLIGYYQETKAEAAMRALKDLTSPTARVLRHGTHTTLPSTELVCGDVVFVESGTKVPADIRLIDSQELMIDESMLTGESVHTLKKALAEIPQDASLGDRRNMLYAGTVVQRGRGKGLVVAAGVNSELGQITKNIVEAEETISPLQRRLARFGKNLSITIGIAIGVLFLAGWLQGNSLLQMFLTSVGLAVSAIPEGLPVSVTVALSIGVYSMAKKNAIIRKLAAVETLGSTTIICTDKTGTLTENAMTVTRIVTGGELFEVSGIGYDADGEIRGGQGVISSVDHDSPLGRTLLIGAICTESRLVEREDGVQLIGDPTEGALIASAKKAGIDVEDVAAEYPIINIRPFESELQYMAVTIRVDGKKMLLVKGSIEKILAMCDRVQLAGGPAALDADTIRDEAAALSAQTLRVIACCWRELPEESTVYDETSYHDCVFSGLQGMYDPPRESAKQAIADCKSAGIKVIMITGDHRDTARAIAEELRLDDEHIAVITGAELDQLDDKHLRGICDITEVYARVSPMHKLRIVRELQNRNHIVTMTGDGVNDAPALKAANIGVAMGSGTDVAKEASSMVVMDNSFASIAAAVRYGRVIFDNLRHIILFVLSTSFGGVLTIMASILAGMPLPLLPAQLLWINLVTDGISTFPLAYESEHGNVMKRPPRPVDAGLVPKEMLVTILFAGIIMMLGTLAVYKWALFTYDYQSLTPDLRGFPLERARTMAFVTLALFQIWNVHNSRSVHSSLFSIGLFSNRPLLIIMLVSLSLQVAAVHLPGLNTLLRVTPLTLQEWFICVGTSLSIIVLIEIKKLFTRRWSVEVTPESPKKKRIRHDAD